MIENQTKYTSAWLKKFKGLETLTDGDANNAITQLQELKTILLEIDIEQASKQKIFNLENTNKQVACVIYNRFNLLVKNGQVHQL